MPNSLAAFCCDFAHGFAWQPLEYAYFEGDMHSHMLSVIGISDSLISSELKMLAGHVLYAQGWTDLRPRVSQEHQRAFTAKHTGMPWQRRHYWMGQT